MKDYIKMWSKSPVLRMRISWVGLATAIALLTYIVGTGIVTYSEKYGQDITEYKFKYVGISAPNNKGQCIAGEGDFTVVTYDKDSIILKVDNKPVDTLKIVSRAHHGTYGAISKVKGWLVFAEVNDEICNLTVPRGISVIYTNEPRLDLPNNCLRALIEPR